MNSVDQISEANGRLNKALQDLRRFDLDVFTETEVKFRLETAVNTILIVQSDLRSMKKEWQESNLTPRAGDGASWHCPDCNYENAAGFTQCVMCGTPRA